MAAHRNTRTVSPAGDVRVVAVPCGDYRPEEITFKQMWKCSYEFVGTIEGRIK